MPLLLKNYSLAEVTYLLIRFNKINFFPWNRKNTNIDDTYKQNTNTHTKNSEKGNMGKGHSLFNPIFYQPLPF